MMSVDPPRPDVDSDDDSPRRSHDAPEGREGASPSPPIPSTETLRDAPTRLPKRIGHYHVKRVLAAGGMGTVYEATQEKPRRTVALKLMRQGIASRSALRRFEYESQILARLRHPGIAQVYEAGTHRDDSGTVPFFAMEYIVGARPITKYVKEKKLGTRERMILFAQVCDAIHHGHQKGIIHRDLKPSNILVDATGQVKIIDFGVARSTDSDMAVTTLQTDIGQLIGTLQYMSPEQCEADPHNIDTRSDVYALGVVFYELLCGKLPYNVTRVAMHEATRIIREERPTKLSTLNKTLRGDVETVALKALEKDRERRYQSATDFGQDIRRYLSNEAIIARPPSIVYQLRVFARRNKGAVGALTAIMLLMAGGVVTATVLYLRAESERRRAVDAENLAERRLADTEEARAAAESVTQFLSEMLAAVEPGMEGVHVTVRQLLDETSETIGEQFPDQPLIEARLRKTIGSAYYALGLYDEAERQQVPAARIFRRILGERNRTTLAVTNDLANTLYSAGKFDQADGHHRRTLELRRRVLGEEHEATLGSMENVGLVLRGQRRFAEANELLQRTLRIKRRVLGEEDPGTLNTMGNLALVLWDQLRFDEAESLYRKTIEGSRRVLGDRHPDTLSLMGHLGTVLAIQGKYADAEAIQRQTLEIRRGVLGEDHLYTLGLMSHLGGTLTSQHKYAEAESVHRQALEIAHRALGDEDGLTLKLMGGLGHALSCQGKYAEAETLLQQALTIQRRVHGPQVKYVAVTLHTLARVQKMKGNYDEAERLYRESLVIRRNVFGNDHPTAAATLQALGVMQCGRGKLEEADTLLREAVEITRASLGAGFWRTAITQSDYGDCLTRLARYEEAERQLLEAHAVLKAALGAENEYTIKATERLESLYVAWGKPDKAAKYRAALSEQESAEPTDHEQPTPSDADDENSKTSDDPPGAGG